ncbi:MAG: ABC transporter permease, partial [Muribaculaceae bacterium]|nr:ABC transporter permease [Muribaculaceae bacterium]
MKNYSITVWRLLRRNISVGQLVGYALANFVGLTIVLTALQFYIDVASVWDSDDSFVSRDYLIISREVSGLGSLVGSTAPTTFSPTDIADVSEQSWVERVGAFTASAYKVYACVEIGGRRVSTDLFFESIPDDFFDVKPVDWGFDPQNPVIPIILNKEYLSLYNFGFASSHGLPQLSEAMIGIVPLNVSISGQGKQMWLPARVVGFSSRLNTIAVPEDFMSWANEHFADEEIAPSRLIIEVNNPGDPQIDDYMYRCGYEVAGDNATRGKVAYFMSIVTIVVVAIGTIISLLAFFILMLSIYLLMHKNRQKLHDLMLLGYSPARLSRY